MTPVNNFFPVKKTHLVKKNSHILNLFRFFETSFQKVPVFKNAQSYNRMLLIQLLQCWL